MVHPVLPSSSCYPHYWASAHIPTLLCGLWQSELPVGTAVAPEGRSLSAAGPPKPGWNPFEEPPFTQTTDEDHIFGAEFDKIKRGSQSSKYFYTLKT